MLLPKHLSYSIVSIIVFLAQGVHAAIIEGSSSAVFDSPSGPPGIVAAGVGTDSFTWGDPGTFGVGENSLKFTGASFATETETEFKLGTLDYFNGTTEIGTQAESVRLVTSVGFSQPDIGTKQFTFDLDLTNTTNSGASPEDNADIVSLPNLVSPDVFDIDGVAHTLSLEFGDVSENGFSEVDQFFVVEGGSATADLVGVVTADIAPPPSAVPIPGALPLFVSALTGLIVIGRKMGVNKVTA